MYNLKDIKDVHFEITSKCQAKCPMCPRRIAGGPLNPFIKLDEVSLETFKKWFPESFIKQLNSMFMCGNLGDPIISKDTLEIYQYLREVNPNISLAMHTNGSAREPAWWEKIAKAKVKVTFGLDGLQDTNHLYRISTNFDKIIKNAKAFIDAGGFAKWHMLVFEHNEHQVEEANELSKKIGFKSFQTKISTRGFNLAGTTPWKRIAIPKSKKYQPPELVDGYVETPVSCKAIYQEQFFITPDNMILPCCYVHSELEAIFNCNNNDSISIYNCKSFSEKNGQSCYRGAGEIRRS